MRVGLNNATPYLTAFGFLNFCIYVNEKQDQVLLMLFVIQILNKNVKIAITAFANLTKIIAMMINVNISIIAKNMVVWQRVRNSI